QLAMRVEIDRPRRERLPIGLSAVNYCAFRGMLNRSFIYFRGRAGFHLPLSERARLTIGDHPRMDAIRRLEPGSRPLFVAFFPETQGVLDDHCESWFLSYDRPPTEAPEGLESVVGLGLGQEWLAPPNDPQAGTAAAPGGRASESISA